MFDGKVAVVTGAAKRTGRAIAEVLAENGAEVVVHYRSSRDEAEEFVASLRAVKRPCYSVGADIGTPEGAESFVAEVMQRSGRIDILINNVGEFLVKRLDSVTPDEWSSILNSNLTATFLMCRTALAHMVDQNYGRIVNLGESGADAVASRPNITPYMIGKTGVLILTKSLAEIYGSYDITVNAVSPGILENSVTKPRGGSRSIPKQRYASYGDIINAILFLLSDRSGYITGADIKVSGGWNS